MTQTNRLILNIVATSLRSLYVMVCGLLTGRWMLAILGHEDYGLLSLVGGLIAFITVFNAIFSSSVSRYYAYAVGAAQQCPEAGLRDCQSWFNVALFIHLIIPLLLFLVGYALGVYAIQNWITIPQDRVDACIWIFRFSCLSCFVGMLCVPFRAMYIAKQFIAELTIYTFVTSTLHLLALYYMVTHPGDWLVVMSFWMMLQIVLPAAIIILRAMCIFLECRISFGKMFNFLRMKELFSFAGWQFLSNFGAMLQTQANAILVNQFLGATFNSSNTIATTISGHSQMLANEINTAFLPAITNNYGAKKYTEAYKLAYMCCKYGALLILLFVLPLTLEMSMIINLWLTNPPPLVAPLCVCVCWTCVLNKLTSGQWMVVNASGKIAKINILSCCAYLIAPVVLGGAFLIGTNLLWLGYALLIAMVAMVVVRLICAQHQGLSIRIWGKTVFIPILFVSTVSLAIGFGIRVFFAPSIFRLFLVGAITLVVFFYSSWQFVMSIEEKKWILQKVRAKLKKR